MRAILSFVLLFVSFIPATLGQQPTPGDKSLTPAAAQTAYEVKIEFNHRVPMRDRTELSADIYRPNATGRFPVILARTPYTKTSASTLKIARYFVAHGYVLVAMDVRGRGDSDGTFEPYRNDGQDGYDAIEWYLDLWNTCQLYRKGHRVRLEISSSAFPKYDRNLNTGEALGQTTRMQAAQQKIYHDRERPSYVVLPIVPRKP